MDEVKKPHGNKGRPKSEAHKAALRKALKGRVRSQAEKDAISAGMRRHEDSRQQALTRGME